MELHGLDWAAVMLLGGVVGASELISRYKDDPGAALRSWPALFYIAINSTASAAALALITANGWFGASRWIQILVAGASAMAFFRTSLFVVRAGDRDVGVGPSGFLQIFLAAADRAVDRRRAAARSNAVAEVMKGIDLPRNMWPWPGAAHARITAVTCSAGHPQPPPGRAQLQYHDPVQPFVRKIEYFPSDKLVVHYTRSEGLALCGFSFS
jgi:hypothetical protein